MILELSSYYFCPLDEIDIEKTVVLNVGEVLFTTSYLLENIDNIDYRIEDLEKVSKKLLETKKNNFLGLDICFNDFKILYFKD